MTGPEHYAAGERLLKSALDTHMDTSDDPAPREEYATEADWDQALEISRALHEQAIRTATLFTAMAQAHFTAAVAAATALNDAINDSGDGGLPREDWLAWTAAAGEPKGGASDGS